MITSKAVAFFEAMPRSVVPRYMAYWRRLRPLSHQDVLRRWLLAFCSVHTTWWHTVRAYNAIKDCDWLQSKRRLVGLLARSGVGLQNQRGDYIWEFVRKFWEEPSAYAVTRADQRDELVLKTRGLGHAKVSFALNMAQPTRSRVVCLDVHMLRLYGLEKLDYKSRRGFEIYRRAERDWVRRSGEVPPYITHSIFWDRAHGRYNSRYWSHVLE